MKVIIAGSRKSSYPFARVVSAANESGWIGQMTEVVSGGAEGIDESAEAWARAYKIPCKRFPADWKKHGRAAGPIRNREMAAYADALIAVWDGESKGAANMILEMHRQGKPVFVWRVNECVS